MDLVEFIGFMISFGAFLFFILQPVVKEWKRSQHAPVDNQSQPDPSSQLKEFLKALEGDEEEVEELIARPPPPPKKIVTPGAPLRVPAPPKRGGDRIATMDETRFEGGGVVSLQYQEKNRIDPYNLAPQKYSSRVHQILSSLSSKKEMVILKELLDPPKSLR